MAVSPYLKRRLRTLEEARAEAERLQKLLADQNFADAEERRRTAPSPEREREAGAAPG